LQDIERRQLHSSRLRRRPDLGWIVPLLRCEIIIALADWQAAELESLADFGDADMLQHDHPSATSLLSPGRPTAERTDWLHALECCAAHNRREIQAFHARLLSTTAMGRSPTPLAESRQSDVSSPKNDVTWRYFPILSVRTLSRSWFSRSVFIA
jgi:hypothetical protein